MMKGLQAYTVAAVFAWGTAVSWASSSVLHRDVCVIGGGSSGTHAAIHLQQMGHSVALVERESLLGGHVDTYVDHKTNKTHDYGVVVFNNISAVHDYFGHFDIPLANLSYGGGVFRAVNFKTGKEVTNPAPAFGSAVTTALKKWLTILDEYPGIQLGWDLPYPVPADLLMNWGDFLRKHDIEALSELGYLYNQGAGDVLNQPTVYMMKYLERGETISILEGFIVNALDNNQLLYNKAQAELGKSVFVNSYPTYIERYDDHVDVHIQTPKGPQLIRAKKLMIAIEPLVNSLQFLDLDQHEKSIFGQFNNSYYYDSIVKNIGIPDNTTLSNSDPAAAYKVPALPGVYSISPTGISGLHAAYYGSSHFLTIADVKKDLLASLVRARKGLGYPAPVGKPEIVAFNAHVPFMLTVSTDAIRGGFYKRLQALQGKKNTFYTGAAWNLQASSNLWDFNNKLILPKVVRSLEK